MKKVLLIIVPVLAILFIIGKCTGDKTQLPSTPAVDTTKKTAKSTAIAPAQADNWTYNVDSSDMMNKYVVYTATCEGLNQLQLKSPYDGGSTMSIILRNGFKGKGNDVMITIDKGQFMGSITGDESIKVKFDDEAPKTFSYVDPADASSGIIFITNAKGFINELKKSKQVIIELTIFDNGVQQVKFNTSNLKWK